jgi:prephenate dehydrogenase
MIKQLTIFGAGLIGGSLAKALKKHQFCQKIVGCSRNEANLKLALELGVIDEYTLDPSEAVKEADVVLLAVPMGAMPVILEKIKPHLRNDVVLTDAGSTKGSIVDAVSLEFGEDYSRFVPGHPIAGREQSGVEAALDDLYENRRVILTPTKNTDADATRLIDEMWSVCGALVETLSVDQHDRILAATSHLPHLLAFSLVDSLSSMDECEDIFRYAAGGFRDFTRIASSDPVMWRDICLHNKTAILDMIQLYQDNLTQLSAFLQSDDAESLLNTFQKAKDRRDKFVKKFEEPDV